MLRNHWASLVLFGFGLACSASGGSKTTPGGGATASGASSSTGGDNLVLGSGGNGATLALGGGTTGGSSSNAAPSWLYFSEKDAFGFKDASLPDDVRSQFPTTEVSDGAPSLAYPLPGSMHPNNLGNIEFQWHRGNPDDALFRIDIAGGSQTFQLFVTCNTVGLKDASACSYLLPEPEWLDLGQRFKGASVQASIAGATKGGAATARSASIELFFSPEPVLGGLYYWSLTKQGIMRATFGSEHAELFIAPNSPTNDFACAGCHSVSRNGKVIAFTASADVKFPGMGVQVAPTDDPTQPFVKPQKGVSPAGAGYPRTPGREEPQTQFGQNVALNADGSIAAVNGARFDGQPPGEQWFELRDTKTGLPLMTPQGTPAQWIVGDPLFGPQQLAILPEWAPDGKTIATTLMNRQSGCGWTFFSCYSTIALLPVLGTSIAAAQPLVKWTPSDPMFHFYPSWSPDGQYVAFVSAPTGVTDKGSSDNANAVLRLVPATGGPHTCPGPTCYELTNATQYSLADAMARQGKGSTWPKFTPFSQASGKLLFISFSSQIDYGVKSSGRAQLWMAAIDLTKLGKGDPSFTPIWLPHQDIEDENFTPYWTEILPCNVDADGGCKGCVGTERCVVDSANQCQCSVVVK
jgi:hypothetical protein